MSAQSSRQDLPPWEVRRVRQVPFVEVNTKVDGEGQEPQSQPPHKNARAGSKASNPAPSLETSFNSTSSCGANATMAPLPYETQTDISHMTTAEMSRLAAQLPLTPPGSIPKTASRSSSVSPPEIGNTKALPGTMSSRPRDQVVPERPRARRGKRNQRTHVVTGEEEPQASIGKKFKTAVRDLFHKSPVDEGKFEKIESRHWTDDY